jgi:hypothetical protein
MADRVREEEAPYGQAPLERVVAQVEYFPYEYILIGERFMLDLLQQARDLSEALKSSHIPFAVIGGLAVRAYVGKVDPSAMMTTRDIDVLMRRDDLEGAKRALARLGYAYRVVMGTPAFIPHGKKFRDGIHVLVAGDKPRPGAQYPAPDLDEAALEDSPEGFPVIDLNRLVFLKLGSYRPKDVAHLQDFAELGLLFPRCPEGWPVEFQSRLDQIFELNRGEGRPLPDEGATE